MSPVRRRLIYFFAKQQQFVQCEIHPGPPHVFRLIDSDGEELTERYGSATELQERWYQVATQLTRIGWSGPFGPDLRT